MYKDQPKITHTSSASVLVTKEEAGALFLNQGEKGEMFESEVPVILRGFTEYAVRRGKKSCEEGEDNCTLAGSVGDFNPTTGWNCQYAGQIGFRCSCNNNGVSVAYETVIEDLEGTISRYSPN